MIKKSTLVKKISSYSGLASLLLVESAKSQILYHKLATPDTLTAGAGIHQGQYYLDLDNDGKKDFEIIDHVTDSVRYATVRNVSGSGTSAKSVADEGRNLVFPQSKNHLIDSLNAYRWGAFGILSGIVCRTSYTSFCSHVQIWPFEDQLYSSLRINKSDGYHYGWLRMSVLAPDSSEKGVMKIVVYDYAYQQTANRALESGDTGFFNSSMPSVAVASIHAVDCENYATVKVANLLPNEGITWFKNYDYEYINKFSDSTFIFSQQQNGIYFAIATLGQNATVTNTISIDIQSPPPALKPSIEETGDLLVSSLGKSYQWYNGPYPILYDTTKTTLAQVTGDYKVMITDTNGCSSISDGIQVNAQDRIFLIGRLLYVQIETKNFIGGTLNILTSGGQSVLKENINSNFFTVNLSDPEKGIYFVQLLKNDNQSVTKIFVY